MQNSKRLSVTFTTSRRNATLEDEVGLGQESDPRKLEIFLNYSNYKYENEGEHQSFRTDRLIRYQCLAEAKRTFIPAALI